MHEHTFGFALCSYSLCLIHSLEIITRLGQWESIVASLATKPQFSEVNRINIKLIWKRNSDLQTQKKTFVRAAARAAEFTMFVVLARQRLGRWESIVAGLAIKWQFSGVDYINIEWIWERNSGLQTQRRPLCLQQLVRLSYEHWWSSGNG